MKLERHAKIIELINQYAIETQEELASRLNEAGFRVTQATVSRDIRELKLTKMSLDGRQRYVIVPGPGGQLGDKYIGILRESFLSMDMAQNILVVKTVAGMAMAAAAAGADGLMIEVHNDPQHAWCDGPQSITPEAFAALAEDVRHILPYCQYDYES